MKKIIMINVLVFILLISSCAFASIVSDVDDFIAIANDGTISEIKLGADIVIDEEITINVDSSDRYIDTNGYKLVLDNYLTIFYFEDELNFTFMDSIGNGVVVSNGTKIRAQFFEPGYENNKLQFISGSYVQPTSLATLVIDANDTTDGLNIIIDGASFYQYSSSPFLENDWNYQIRNMNIMGYYSDSYVGFANIEKPLSQVMDNNTKIFVNGKLLDVDRNTKQTRDVFFNRTPGNYIVITNMATYDDTSIIVPTFDMLIEEYGDVGFKPVVVQKGEESGTIDGDFLKFELEGKDKNCFATQLNISTLNGEGGWNNPSQFGIKPITGLEVDKYDAFVKLVYDSDEDGEYETLLGIGVASVKVSPEIVECDSYWGTSGGMYIQSVTIDGETVYSYSEPLSLYAGDTVTILVECAEHYEAISGILRYNNINQDYFTLTRNEQGLYEGTFVIPGYDFKIGISTLEKDNRLIFYSHNGSDLVENVYYEVGEPMILPGSFEGWTNGDLALIGWSSSLDGTQDFYEPGDEYTTSETQPIRHVFWAQWGEASTDKGDINQDGNINIIDVKLLLQWVISNSLNDPTPAELKIRDMNNDSHINIIDVKLLLQKVISNS